MKGTAKIIYLFLLLALLSDPSTELFSRRRRKCPKGIARIFARRRCRRVRRPAIKMVPTTLKPKTSPPVKATTPQPTVAVFNPAVQRHSSGLPYCKGRDVNAILRPTRRRTKRATPWPYECRYAGIVKHLGEFQFVWPIFDCCNECNFPAFTKCVGKKDSPEWLCPSQGLHCIVDCVNKHNPGKIVSSSGLVTASSIVPVNPPVAVRPIPGKPDGKQPSVAKPRPKPGIKPVKPVLNSCEKLDQTKNGEKCVRKLCVPLRLKP